MLRPRFDCCLTSMTRLVRLSPVNLVL
jgi:hypothetical protein